MDEFCDKYNLLKLNQDQICNLNTPRALSEIIKNLPIPQILGPEGFSAEFNQTSKEELILILFKSFQ